MDRGPAVRDGLTGHDQPGSGANLGHGWRYVRQLGATHNLVTAVVQHGPVTTGARKVLRALISIGYEGKTVDALVGQLVQRNVWTLVDVRLTPLSRKPGLSKTKLAETLRAAGIGYFHHRALGNPKDNRAGFRAGEPESMKRYSEILDTARASDALAHVGALLDGGAVALLCFEKDHTECHRSIVINRLLETRPEAAVVHV